MRTHLSLKKYLRTMAAVLLFCTILFTSGCGILSNLITEPAGSESSSESSKPEKESESSKPEMSENSKESEESKEESSESETEEAPEEDPSISLHNLRQAMTETTNLFAVAYIGFNPVEDPHDIYDFVEQCTPQLWQDLPFLSAIPYENFVGDGYGELYCIVPADPDATVAVSRGTWGLAEEITYDEVIYQSESGDPIYLHCNGGGFDGDMQVTITDSDGNTAVWYPMLDDTRRVMPLENDNWEDLLLDFSPYAEPLTAIYRSMEEESSGWRQPMVEDLIGTSWTAEDYLLTADVPVSYILTFNEDTLYVRWNDGIDEEPHEYPDASWELIYEHGFAILVIDFREFAGIMRYNILINDEIDMLYTAIDVSSGDLAYNMELENLRRELVKNSIDGAVG